MQVSSIRPAAQIRVCHLVFLCRLSYANGLPREVGVYRCRFQLCCQYLHILNRHQQISIRELYCFEGALFQRGT